MKHASFLYCILFVILIGSFIVRAAPSLQITKPPVTPVPSWTGPVQDPHAVAGQWFYDYATGTTNRRTHEFYDNVFPGFGGGPASFGAINGVVVNLLFDPNPPFNLVGFDILATIINDTPTLDPWMPGSNQHNENLAVEEQYVGELFDVKLTAEFAVSDMTNIPALWMPPYFDNFPHIIATNEDEIAWYCWTPDNEEALIPYGNYYVPTWDFGNIAPGASASRVLSFSVIPPGLDLGDFRRAALEMSFNDGSDILMNRTTSLKISTWLDTLFIDMGTPYPEEPLRGSDCSVFHNIPEPAVVIILFPLLFILRKLYT